MKNETVNKAMPAPVKKLDVSFDRKERIRVGCDVHKWMGAWIIVTEHPYYAATGKDGTFRFENVPVGTHTVRIWHEKLGKQEKEVTVTAGEETQVEFVCNERPNGTPLQISEVKLDTAPDCLYIHGRQLMVL